MVKIRCTGDYLESPFTPKEVKNTPKMAGKKFSNEKKFQDVFSEALKRAGWVVSREVSTNDGKGRIDILAYHSSYGVWFGFELKIPDGIKSYTKALKQMVEKYRDKKFGRVKPPLICFITPDFLRHSHLTSAAFVCKRFFWRWGFGVGDYETMKVEFVNGDSIATLDLRNPYNGWCSPKEKIAEIKRRLKID